MWSWYPITFIQLKLFGIEFHFLEILAKFDLILSSIWSKLTKIKIKKTLCYFQKICLTTLKIDPKVFAKHFIANIYPKLPIIIDLSPPLVEKHFLGFHEGGRIMSSIWSKLTKIKIKKTLYYFQKICLTTFKIDPKVFAKHFIANIYPKLPNNWPPPFMEKNFLVFTKGGGAIIRQLRFSWKTKQFFLFQNIYFRKFFLNKKTNFFSQKNFSLFFLQ